MLDSNYIFATLESGVYIWRTGRVFALGRIVNDGRGNAFNKIHPAVAQDLGFDFSGPDIQKIKD